MDAETEHRWAATEVEPNADPGTPTVPQRARSLLAGRTNGFPGWVVLIELFIGLGWLRAGAEKAIDPSWWRGNGLTGFLSEHQDLSVVWYRPFIDAAVAPHLVTTAAIVLVAQVVAGLCLITGRHRSAGLGIGLFLNLNFLAAGAVNPSAFYLLSQGAVALWMAEQTAWRGVIRRLFTVRAAALALATASLPFVRTIQPSAIIDDPAAMFVCGGLLTALAADVAIRNRGAGPGGVSTTDAGHPTGAATN